MQTLVVTSAVHKAAREFINDYNIAVFHNVVNVAFHNAVGAYCLIYMVGNGDILGIVKVFNAEILLGFFNARGGKSCGVRLFVHNVIAVIVSLFVARLIVHFLNLYHFKGQGKAVRLGIQVGRFIALTRYYKRSSRLVYKY